MKSIRKIPAAIKRDLTGPLKREILFRKAKPRVATLFLTYRCTSKCKTCTAWMRPSEKERELDLASWEKIVYELHGSGVRIAELFGGDIFLRKDILFGLIKRMKALNFTVHIPTNAILVDENTAQGLAELGVDYLYLSTDGVAETHDHIRRIDGNFSGVEQAIDMVLAARGERQSPRLICNTTVSKLNFDQLGKIADFAAHKNFDEIHFEYVGEMSEEHIQNSVIDGIEPTPFYVKQDDSVLLNREEAVSLRKTLTGIRKKYQGNRLTVVTINIDTLSLEDLHLGTIPNRKCYVERTEVTIDPYGNLVACPIINNYIFGNVVNERFDRIWNNGLHQRFRQNQISGKIALCEHCILGVQRNHSFLAALKRNLLFERGWALPK
jgi:MoaA/NifB/PqqE/SkfB family radical SAM enzyme